MKFYEASSTIAATPDQIWPILTDAPNYTAWDSGIARLEGRVAPGEKIKVFSKVNPQRGFAVKVVEFEPGRRMVWKGGMPLGLFRGVRTYTLTPQQSGGTRFTMREEFTGLMLPLIWKSMPDLGPSFEQFARGLKERVESGGA